MFGNSICVSRIEIFNKRFGRLADEISQKVKPKYTHTHTNKKITIPFQKFQKEKTEKIGEKKYKR